LDAVSPAKLIDEFLQETGNAPAAVVAGAAAARPKVTREQQEELIIRIENARRENSKLANLLFSAQFAVVMVAMFAAWTHRDDARYLLAILAATSGVFVVLLWRFRKFWARKVSCDMLAAVLPSATTDEALKMVQALSIQASDAPRRR
jgi:hypothetical protein